MHRLEVCIFEEWVGPFLPYINEAVGYECRVWYCTSRMGFHTVLQPDGCER
jgi:hypothetical protein